MRLASDEELIENYEAEIDDLQAEVRTLRADKGMLKGRVEELKLDRNHAMSIAEAQSAKVRELEEEIKLLHEFNDLDPEDSDWRYNFKWWKKEKEKGE